MEDGSSGVRAPLLRIHREGEWLVGAQPFGAGPEAPVPTPKPLPPFRRGRHETRTCCVITNPSAIRDISPWTKLTAICMVVSQRVIDGVSSSEIRYFIGSAAETAKGYLQWVRGHWGIENSLHWALDVCFREDEQRRWAGNSAENLTWLRKLALCLFNADFRGGKSVNHLTNICLEISGFIPSHR